MPWKLVPLPRRHLTSMAILTPVYLPELTNTLQIVTWVLRLHQDFTAPLTRVHPTLMIITLVWM
jgi:hypothetical protein